MGGCIKWELSSRVHKRIAIGFVIAPVWALYLLAQFIYLKDHWCPRAFYDDGECAKLKIRKLLGALTFACLFLAICYSLFKLPEIGVNYMLTELLERTRVFKSFL